MFIGAKFNLTKNKDASSILGWDTIRIVDRVLVSRTDTGGRLFYKYNFVCIVDEEKVPEVVTINESEFEEELISGFYVLDTFSLKAIQARGWK